MPRLGQKYELEEEEVSREEYQSEVYKASGLPPAPAVMVEDELAGHRGREFLKKALKR